MSLDSDHLDAFLAVARSAGFTAGARQLGITQSALSQRVAQLEDHLGVSLFIRDREGTRLTTQGQAILRYCELREGLESELLSEIAGKKNLLSGTIRVGAYSSVLRSVVLPSISGLLRENPEIHFEFASREIRDLPSMLVRGEIQFMILDRTFQRAGIESIQIGEEQNVLVEPTRHHSRSDYFLDHDPEDTTTDLYFRIQEKKPPKIRRGYMDDVYGILNGVELGLGRAVISKHLIRNRPGIRILKGKSHKNPVVLHYPTQPYYTKLHLAVRDAFIREAKKYLG